MSRAQFTSSPDLLAEIQARVVTPRPDCQIWTNAADRGYGRIWLDGTMKRVHRVVWEITNGPIPYGLTIDHLCRVRTCANVEHMELVTLEENSRRGAAYRFPGTRRKPPRIRRPRALSPVCSRGHEMTPENTYIRPSTTRRRCRECKRDEDRARRQRQREVAA